LIPVSGGEPADHRHHRGDLAPVMCGVVRHVLEQRPERGLEQCALEISVLDDPLEIGRRQRLDEGSLVPRESVTNSAPGIVVSATPVQRDSHTRSAP
jgi:hypothetical protein